MSAVLASRQRLLKRDRDHLNNDSDHSAIDQFPRLWAGDLQWIGVLVR